GAAGSWRRQDTGGPHTGSQPASGLCACATAGGTAGGLARGRGVSHRAPHGAALVALGSVIREGRAAGPGDTRVQVAFGPAARPSRRAGLVCARWNSAPDAD